MSEATVQNQRGQLCFGIPARLTAFKPATIVAADCRQLEVAQHISTLLLTNCFLSLQSQTHRHVLSSEAVRSVLIVA